MERPPLADTSSSATLTELAQPILHLHVDSRNQPPTPQQHLVTWGREVIDNEFLNRKKTKICCIFHRTREFGESSSDSSTDSSSDESDASENGFANNNNVPRDENEPENEKSSKDDNSEVIEEKECEEPEICHHHRKKLLKQKKKKQQVNAYEKQPKNSNKSKPEQAEG
ncbi:Type 1 phosphatases regulator YPI1 [Spathaspora sp. JA1]|nr:Type 1 phosphatases regulator YPI1 [Spathaspora sp. JA1]